MYKDKTAHNLAAAAAVLAYHKGHLAAERLAVETLIPVLTDPMKWLCTKPQECSDRRSYCTRTTEEPCCFRVQNPRVVELQNAVKDILIKYK